MRVFVVTHDHSGQLLKVCQDRDAFMDWLDTSEYPRHDLNVKDCHVYEGDSP